MTFMSIMNSFPLYILVIAGLLFVFALCLVTLKQARQRALELGLSKEEIPRVFDRFYKTDRSRGVDKNGVGLGLYLVRSIINLHGGDIIVKSMQGEYTEFVFSVPTAKTKNPALVKGKEKEYPNQNKEAPPQA